MVLQVTTLPGLMLHVTLWCVSSVRCVVVIWLETVILFVVVGMLLLAGVLVGGSAGVVVVAARHLLTGAGRPLVVVGSAARPAASARRARPLLAGAKPARAPGRGLHVDELAVSICLLAALRGMLSVDRGARSRLGWMGRMVVVHDPQAVV